MHRLYICMLRRLHWESNTWHVMLQIILHMQTFTLERDQEHYTLGTSMCIIVSYSEPRSLN